MLWTMWKEAEDIVQIKTFFVTYKYNQIHCTEVVFNLLEFWFYQMTLQY